MGSPKELAKRFFLLDFKRFTVIVIVALVSIFLHNWVSALLGTEEALFFILVVFIIPIYLLLSVIFTLFYKLRKRKSGINEG